MEEQSNNTNAASAQPALPNNMTSGPQTQVQRGNQPQEDRGKYMGVIFVLVTIAILLVLFVLAVFGSGILDSGDADNADNDMPEDTSVSDEVVDVDIFLEEDEELLELRSDPNL